MGLQECRTSNRQYVGESFGRGLDSWVVRLAAFADFRLIAVGKEFKVPLQAAALYHTLIFTFVVWKAEENVLPNCLVKYPGLLRHDRHTPHHPHVSGSFYHLWEQVDEPTLSTYSERDKWTLEFYNCRMKSNHTDCYNIKLPSREMRIIPVSEKRRDGGEKRDGRGDGVTEGLQERSCLQFFPFHVPHIYNTTQIRVNQSLCYGGCIVVNSERWQQEYQKQFNPAETENGGHGRYYIGKTIGKEGDEVMVQFLRKKDTVKGTYFVHPSVTEKAIVGVKDIVTKNLSRGGDLGASAGAMQLQGHDGSGARLLPPAVAPGGRLQLMRTLRPPVPRRQDAQVRRKYGLLKSIYVWLRYHSSRDLLFDAVAFCAFTPLAILGTYLGVMLTHDYGGDSERALATYQQNLTSGRIIGIMAADIYDRAESSGRSDVGSLGTRMAALGVVSIMTIINFSYLTWFVIRAQHYTGKWYTWWRRHFAIAIILPPEVLEGKRSSVEESNSIFFQPNKKGIVLLGDSEEILKDNMHILRSNTRKLGLEFAVKGMLETEEDIFVCRVIVVNGWITSREGCSLWGWMRHAHQSRKGPHVPQILETRDF
ncbi:hypothetical protein C0J52_00763 [Blattella germanica]|nr:hypothetical protein C0J52_00763 [Blattella germanica]